MRQPLPSPPELQRLLEREQRYRALFEMSQEGFCVIEMVYDANGRPADYRFLETNPAFERHTGLVDAVGKTALELVPGLEGHWVETYGRVAETGEPDRFTEESPVMERWFEVEAYRTGKPKDRQVAVLFRDITAQTHAEERIRQAEWRLKSALRASGMGSWSLSRTARTVRLDAIAASLLCRAAGESPYAEAWTWVHLADRPLMLRGIRAALKKASPLDVTFRVDRPDGSSRWIRAIGRVLASPSAPVLATGLIQDATAEVVAAKGRRSEFEALTHQVETGSLEIRELSGALTRAEQDERHRIGLVLHEDLQQVLASARWMSHATGDADLTACLTRALALTQSLAHELHPPLDDEDVVPLLGWFAEQCRSLYGLDVNVEAPATLPVPSRDLRRLLYHALRELLFNVAKHAGVSAASIRAGLTDGRLDVTVEDQGVGTEAYGEGADIGVLSLERRLKHVGAELSFDSVPGDGTRVTIHLPLGRRDEAAPDEAAPA